MPRNKALTRHEISLGYIIRESIEATTSSRVDMDKHLARAAHAIVCLNYIKGKP